MWGSRKEPATIRVLRRRNFALLWSGGLISMLGDWALFVALPVYVYRLTGSTLATGAIFMARFVPNFVLSSVAGIFVDRWDRRRTLIVTNLVLAVSILPLLVVPSRHWLWLIYVVAFVEASAASFLVAETALLPRLVRDDDLVSANSLNSLNQNVARLAGPALGGLLLGTTGLLGVAVVDAASYATAAFMSALVIVPAGTGAASSSQNDPKRQVAGLWHQAMSEWRDGLRLILGERLLYGLFGVFAFSAVAEGLLSPLFVAFGTNVIQGGTLGYGWLLSAQAIGGIVGSVIVGRFGMRAAATWLVAVGMLLLGVVDLVIWNVPVLAVDLVLMGVVGAPVAAFSAGSMALIQTQVVDQFRGRVLGSVMTTVAPLVLAGQLAAGILSARVGVVPMLDVSATFDICGGVVGFLLLTTAPTRLRPASTTNSSAASP